MDVKIYFFVEELLSIEFFELKNFQGGIEIQYTSI